MTSTVETAAHSGTETAASGGEPTAAGGGNFYVDAWRSMPRDLGYLGLTFLLLVTAYAALSGVFWTGIGALALVVGIFLVIGSLLAARWLGDFELVRLRWARMPHIKPVAWPKFEVSPFWSIFKPLGSANYWLYLLHALIILPLIATITLTIVFSWLVTALALLAAPIVYAIWGRSAVHFGVEGFAWGGGQSTFALVLGVVIGLVLLAVLPMITRGSVWLAHFGARVLGAFRSAELEEQMGNLDAARGAAISAEGHSLRRLERDIHDGPQQRLVRLQMDLAAAERQLDVEPEKARQLIGEAMAQSKEALEELRALSRGFAPPILLDRGLVAALESAAVRSTVPARVVSELPSDVELPQEIERNAYFFASEALTNAAKHSGATDIEVRVATRRLPETDETWLDMVVTDNGAGGAVTVDGHGLAGLDQRLRGFGGVLEVMSPPGGPTIVSAHFPVAFAAPASLS